MILSTYLLQIPVMLLVMIGVGVYMYIQPYQGVCMNTLEVVLLVDILLMIMITSTDHFKVITRLVLAGHVIQFVTDNCSV